jgi:hypothetical protein
MDIEFAASQFLEYLERYGSPAERNLSMDNMEDFRGPCYKPFYRSTSMFWVGAYFEEVLGGETPNVETAAEIVRLAHPYFVKAIGLHWDSWEHLWKFMRDSRGSD